MANKPIEWDPVFAVAVGALLGGMIGYVCFTPPGRRLVDRVDATLDEALDEMRRLQDAAGKVRHAVDEGRHTLYAVEHMTDPEEPARGGERSRR